MKDMLNDMLAQDTGQSVERITKDTDRDFIISATEAVEYGLIDEVITARRRCQDLTLSPRRMVAAEVMSEEISGEVW